MTESELFRETVVEGITVLQFGDWRLGTEDVDNLKAALDAVLAKSRTHPDLVLGLGDVKFLSSGVIGCFVATHNELKAQGGRLVLCDMQPLVGQVFSLARLDTVISTFPTEAEAVEWCRNWSLDENATGS